MSTSQGNIHLQGILLFRQVWTGMKHQVAHQRMVSKPWALWEPLLAADFLRRLFVYSDLCCFSWWLQQTCKTRVPGTASKDAWIAGTGLKQPVGPPTFPPGLKSFSRFGTAVTFYLKSFYNRNVNPGFSGLWANTSGDYQARTWLRWKSYQTSCRAVSVCALNSISLQWSLTFEDAAAHPHLTRCPYTHSHPTLACWN